ncbi:MAG: BON domain-containing protein, partial [Chloroflexota bacterium]
DDAGKRGRRGVARGGDRARTLRARISGEDRPGIGGRLMLALGAAVGGALAAFVLDPERGRARRARLTDEAAATARRAGAELGRVTRRAGSLASGKLQALRNHGSAEPMPNDATIANKVESELFSDPQVPKGQISINVEQGIVVLRGELSSQEEIDQIEARVRRVPGVWEVRNLMHTVGTPAPTARASR